jgi:hypothetical protein
MLDILALWGSNFDELSLCMMRTGHLRALLFLLFAAAYKQMPHSEITAKCLSLVTFGSTDLWI